MSSGTAGTIVLRDGGATGSVRLTVDTPAVAEGDTVIIPGYIEFDTDVHVTLTDVDAVTVFWNN